MGKLWAIGDSVETTQLFYNKKIFAENNVKSRPPGKS